ncbi:MAG: DNA polymerase/3'-5' exonuclease PolX [Proteobacteria bacterium]|nr:DNA polymerase/3'-5' exonuclease PolX [Pseudomonadota bacterium]
MKNHQFSNREIIQILKEVVAAMEVKGDSFFKIRAYHTAILSIENLTQSVYELWENKRLGEIPGVGQALIDHLTDLFTKGEVKEFQKKRDGLPEGMFELIGLRKVGAKTAYKLATNFDLKSRETALDEVKKLAETHKIQELPGFGAKSEADILDAIENLKMNKSEKKRTLLANAEKVVERVRSYMMENKNTEYCEAMGSFRRRAPTIGDLDFAVASENIDETISHFLKFPEIREVLSQGEKKASVVLNNDLQVDLRVIQKKELGSMLQYFTGNMQHNVILRQYALQNGMSLSEYGIKYQEKLEEFAREEDFYKRLGLQYIVPELRHGKNEIELAKKAELPKLVKLEDIKGDLHTHTIFSDGENSLEEMVSKAREKGYEYIGISDHAPSVQSRGEKEVRHLLEKRREEIENLNKHFKDIKILFGMEVNILADYSLGLPDEMLELLDYSIASIHTSFEMDRDKMTERILTALANPNISIWGHPSGRLINEREGIDVNWTKIFEFASKNKKIIEINSQPQRLDLADDLVYEAIKAGVEVIINTDSHNVSSLDLMKYGIDVARRGFCEKHHIINTLHLEKLTEKI